MKPRPRPRFDFTAPGWQIAATPKGGVGYVNHALRLAPGGYINREALLRNAPDMVETPYTVAQARLRYAEAYAPEEAPALRAELAAVEQSDRQRIQRSRSHGSVDQLDPKGKPLAYLVSLSHGVRAQFGQSEAADMLSAIGALKEREARLAEKLDLMVYMFAAPDGDFGHTPPRQRALADARAILAESRL